MDLLTTLIFATVEGITEFLPISSTGHLVLVSNLLHIQETEFVKTFQIFIQLGAILAVVVLYWRLALNNIKLWKNVILAFLPTGVLGLVFYKIIKSYLLGNIWVTLLSLLIGGIILILMELYFKQQVPTKKNLSQLRPKDAVLIGLAQSVSMIPGVSRSAATIIGGLLLGLDRKTAVEFSFLLAVPTMLAATGLDLVKTNMHFSQMEYISLAVGFVWTFVVALFAIKFLIKFIQKNNFTPFGVYRILLAIIFALFMLH